MKPTPLLATATLLLCVLALPALSDRRKTLSSTEAFLIDGKRYLLEKPARKEIASANPIFDGALREVDGTTSSSSGLPVPKGLRPEHVVQMVSDSGPVELAVGSIEDRVASVQNRLPKSGWKFIDLPRSPEPVAAATFSKGKESYVVFLDEKSGKFLLVRKPD